MTDQHRSNGEGRHNPTGFHLEPQQGHDRADPPGASADPVKRRERAGLTLSPEGELGDALMRRYNG